MSSEQSRESRLAIVANNLKKLREKEYPGHGGRKECAEALGVSQQQWSPWELGQKIPRNNNLEKIAQFFGVTFNELITDTGDLPVEKAFPSLAKRKHGKSAAEKESISSPVSDLDTGDENLLSMDKGVTSLSTKIKTKLKESLYSQGFNGTVRFRFSVTGVDFDDG